MSLKLHPLNNSEYNEAERLATASNTPLNQCPTCGSKPEQIADGVYGIENGTYKFEGEEHQCDCDTQKLLRRHYLAANIGGQYMKIDFLRDFDGDNDVKEHVQWYLDNWDNIKRNGMGIEFGGRTQGVGKTFAATHIGKELIKRGEKVFFLDFKKVIAGLGKDGGEVRDRLEKTSVVILDDIVPAISDAQSAYFATQLEELIRWRTNNDLVTIITTNLTKEELEENYPRVYSLLSAKQIRLDMTGVDARKNKIAEKNLELVLNGETRPIC